MTNEGLIITAKATVDLKKQMKYLTKEQKLQNNISPAFNPNDSHLDKPYFIEVLRYEKTPQAIIYFNEICHNLTDYGYWFLLSTLWVSYCGYSDLGLWKKLFNSKRPLKKISIMKPNELKEFKRLPKIVKVYRAHRKDETDWIAYTLSLDKAKSFLAKRPNGKIASYFIDKNHLTALFLRRGEKEVILTNKDKANLIRIEDVGGFCDVGKSN